MVYTVIQVNVHPKHESAVTPQITEHLEKFGEVRITRIEVIENVMVYRVHVRAKDGLLPEVTRHLKEFTRKHKEAVILYVAEYLPTEMEFASRDYHPTAKEGND